MAWALNSGAAARPEEQSHDRRHGTFLRGVGSAGVPQMRRPEGTLGARS